MTKEEFIKRRQPAWRELELMLDARLEGEHLLRFGVLYRRLTSDLAHARQRYADQNLTDYLNRLAQRGYALVYRTDERQRGGIVRFFTRTFPMVMRRRMRLVGLSAAIFLLPAVVAFVMASMDESIVDYFMGVDFIEMTQQRIAQGVAVEEVSGDEMSLVSAAVMTNNIQVSMLAFAGGALGGTLTVYMMIVNGLMLGSFSAMLANAGLFGLMIITIMPHGVPELWAIVIAGAAGLRLAGGILLPGQLPLRRSIPKAARESLVLFGGTVMLLFIAGLIEGYLSFTAAPESLKVAFIVLGTSFCVLYLIVLPYRLGPAETD